MPKFVYTVRDREGRLESGTAEAVSEDELVDGLQNRGFLVTSIKKEEGIKKKRIRHRLHRRMKIDDLTLVSRQLATMLDAGVPLLRSLDVITQQIESKPLFLAMENVRRDIEAGSTLRDAMDRHPRVFSKFWVNLVETGEASGHLPAALDQVSRYLEASGSLQRKVVSALMYPVVLLCLAAGAVFVFITKVIPIFADLFQNFNVPLPPLTRMVLALSFFVRHYIGYLLGGFIVALWLLGRFIRTEKGGWIFDRLKFKIPLFGSLLQRVAVERFTSGLGTLLKSGVPILYSLEIMGRTADNRVMQKTIADVKENVRSGKSMAFPLENSGIFAPMVVQMITVGEEIGELGRMLDRISAFYEERITTFVSRFATMIEPFILVFMGAIVGTLVISMFLPIFSIAQITRG